jgi:cytochrome c551/c552
MDRNGKGRPDRVSWHAASARLTLAALALVSTAAVAVDGERMARDHGCLNCHYSDSHSTPTLQRLAGRLGHNAERPDKLQEVLQDTLREMRGQSGIHGHQMVSDESALAILQWMAQGAKAR